MGVFFLCFRVCFWGSPAPAQQKAGPKHKKGPAFSRRETHRIEKCRGKAVDTMIREKINRGLRQQYLLVCEGQSRASSFRFSITKRLRNGKGVKVYPCLHVMSTALLQHSGVRVDNAASREKRARRRRHTQGQIR
jgi:hypothetical protein